MIQTIDPSDITPGAVAKSADAIVGKTPKLAKQTPAPLTGNPWNDDEPNRKMRKYHDSKVFDVILSPDEEKELKALAEKHEREPESLIRLAVDMLLSGAKENEGDESWFEWFLEGTRVYNEDEWPPYHARTLDMTAKPILEVVAHTVPGMTVETLVSSLASRAALNWADDGPQMLADIAEAITFKRNENDHTNG